MYTSHPTSTTVAPLLEIFNGEEVRTAGILNLQQPNVKSLPSHIKLSAMVVAVFNCFIQVITSEVNPRCFDPTSTDRCGDKMRQGLGPQGEPSPREASRFRKRYRVSLAKIWSTP